MTNTLRVWRPYRMSSAHRFAADFMQFARADGIKAAVLIGLGTMLEGAGLILLVPVLDIVIPRGHSDWMVREAGAVLVRLGLQTRIGQLAFLLCCFAAVIILRAVILWSRDSALASLRIGFVEAQRTRLVARLATASWPQLSRIQRARINHLLGGDIILVGSCVHFLLQSVVSLCLIVTQWIIAFLLSPMLALFALLAVSVSGLFLVPQLRTPALFRFWRNPETLTMPSESDALLPFVTNDGLCPLLIPPTLSMYIGPHLFGLRIQEPPDLVNYLIRQSISDGFCEAASAAAPVTPIRSLPAVWRSRRRPPG